MFGVIFRRYTFAGMKWTLCENCEEMELKTTSFCEICEYVLADHNSQISPSLHCEISSEEPSSRTNLREDAASTFSQNSTRSTASEDSATSSCETTPAEQICDIILRDHSRSHYSQITFRLTCETALRVHTHRTPLVDSPQKAPLHHPTRQHQQNKFARSFCETILAVVTRRSPPDWSARHHCENILAARPSSQTRHFLRSHSCEFVLAVQPNMKKCDITLRVPSRRTWSQITRVKDSARHIKQTNLASQGQIKLRDESASTFSQILVADVTCISELQWPTPDIFIHYINIFYFCK